MYQLAKAMTSWEIAAHQIVVFSAAFVIATVFYKFGNFGLEAVAFLATWFALDAIAEAFTKLFTTVDEAPKES